MRGRGLKAGLERLAGQPIILTAARRRRSGQTLILAYHNIVEDGSGWCGDASLHLERAAFGQQLDCLAETHEVVPLTELFDVPPRNGPRAVITFDDAYRGAVTHGVEELHRRSLPATIFVAPAFLGGASFWWDALAGEGGLDEAVRARALAELSGRNEEIRAWAAQEGRSVQALTTDRVCAAEADLDKASRVAGITIGSHSWSHARLSALPAAELATELVRPLEWLRERYVSAIPWLSYPYGANSPAVAVAACAAGYTAALRIEGGWLRSPRDANRFALPRLNVPAGLSLDGFRLRVAGLLSR